MNFPLFVLLFILIPLQSSASGKNSPDYVTSVQCQSCHQEQTQNWFSSHHSWAWRKPSLDNVLGNFNNTSITHQGFTYRFTQKEGNFYIYADGPDGEGKDYQVLYTVGVTPLQQYLVQTEKGRLQALDVAWDTEKKSWYHLYPDIDTSAGNGLHWSGVYKNWNSRCAECHVTGYEKRYDPRQDTYNSVQAEIGVGCEACHGPGEAHVIWAKQPDKFNFSDWNGIDKLGLVPTYKAGDAASEINLCAGCHSRREPLGADSPPEGDQFADHYRLSLLRESLYFPDGQIKDEVYVYGSFLQSKMYSRGVRCTHCHDAHSYQLKLKGNAVCTQCHNPQGNPQFSSLRKANYDSSQHHLHAHKTEAAACVSCHMPQRNYMVVDGRRDHGFRIPRPSLSEKIGAPDACSACHQDKSLAWAAASIEKHYPESQQQQPHFAEVFAAIGASALEQSIEDLIDLASNQALPDIVRATAVERCANLPHALTAQEVKVFTADNNALVRMASTRLLRNLDNENKVPLLLPLLQDTRKSVRIEAAKAMLAVPAHLVPGENQQHLQRAMKELQASMLAKADYPEGQLVLGGVALTLKRFDAASQAFQRAVDMDPQLVEAWVILIRIKAALALTAEARNLMLMAIQNNPENHEIQQLAASMGLSIGGKI